MHFGVQGFDPAIEHFGEASEVADFLYGQSSLSQGFAGATRRQYFNSLGHKSFDKRNEPALVTD